jgi:GTP-binding protein
MPQTRFVTQKAFKHGLRPIVVINKIDRDEARPGWVLDQTFDLFDRLGATHEQLDFPVVYASAIKGYASLDPSHRGGDMNTLYQAIRRALPTPNVDPDGTFQLQVSQLDYSPYVGTIGIGRIARGKIAPRHAGVGRGSRRCGSSGTHRSGPRLLGLDRVEVEEASAGDIVAFSGIAAPKISDTICLPDAVDPLPRLVVDEPTINMTFETNTSPFFGREGKFVTEPPTA